MADKLKFSLDGFQDKGVDYYPHDIDMISSVDMLKLENLKKEWKPMTKENLYELIRKRTTKDYHYNIMTAQTDVLSYSENVFPAYQLLMPDVLMDDWLAIVDPHKEGLRDHALHQPLTAYIISELLGDGDLSEGLMINGKSLLSLCVNQIMTSPHADYLNFYFSLLSPNGKTLKDLDVDSVSNIFYFAAIVAALFHDMGYPWQYVKKVRKNLNNVVGFTADKDYTSDGIFCDIKDKLLIYPFIGYQNLDILQNENIKNEILLLINDAYNETHGFPGALAFTILKKSYCKEKAIESLEEAKSHFVIDWASLGIMMHDMQKQYAEGGGKSRYRLSIDTDPLSCLIALADLMEEFERPRGKFVSSKTENNVNLHFSHHCDDVELGVSNGVIELTYNLNDYGRLEEKGAKIEEEIGEYLNPSAGFVDLTAIGITDYKCKAE